MAWVIPDHRPAPIRPGVPLPGAAEPWEADDGLGGAPISGGSPSPAPNTALPGNLRKSWNKTRTNVGHSKGLLRLGRIDVGVDEISATADAVSPDAAGMRETMLGAIGRNECV